MLPEIAVYIHWPFCKSKCPYCDFNSHVRGEFNQDEWLEYYLRELRFYRERTGEREVTSVFFGGGTPSLMEEKLVAALIDETAKLWHLKNDVEITLEANPTSVEVNKFRAFKDAGVNRVSIGIQALNDADLKALGRQHSAAEALNALKTAGEIFDRYSFDLIYARAGQSVRAWQAELSEALKLAQGHMSLYQLTIEKGTPFYAKHKKGELIIPEDDAAADMYDATQEIMQKNNMPAYEVSNHATAGEESRHNLTYWHYGDYIGVGAGAHGRIIIDGKKLATRNHKVPEIWRDNIANPEIEEISPEQQRIEKLMMGLRLTTGIVFDDEIKGIVDNKKLQIVLDEGLIAVDNSNIKVTRKGMIRLNSVLGYIL